MICFDYHQNCRGGKLDKLSALKEKARPSLDEFGLFFARGDHIKKCGVFSLSIDNLFLSEFIVQIAFITLQKYLESSNRI